MNASHATGVRPFAELLDELADVPYRSRDRVSGKQCDLRCWFPAVRTHILERFDGRRFRSAPFFFSVQTLSTIGYGALSPVGVGANLLVAFEAMLGLMMVAIATGLVFTRFSRPRAKIVFSTYAVIAPYGDLMPFEFRIANIRNSQPTNVQATVVLSRLEPCDGKPSRRFHPLTLEREQVMFMPLHWVVVHPVDEESPLRNVTWGQLLASSAEFLILLTGTDETYSRTVHTRSSYIADEVVWNARFEDIYRPPENGLISVDLSKISDVEKLG